MRITSFSHVYNTDFSLSLKTIVFTCFFQIVSPIKVNQLSVFFKNIILEDEEEFFVQELRVATVNDFKHLDQEDWDCVKKRIGKIPTRRLRTALQVSAKQVVYVIFLSTHSALVFSTQIP